MVKNDFSAGEEIISTAKNAKEREIFFVLLFLRLFACFAVKYLMQKPLIIAHRGASALAPENTLAAFRRAIADSAEGLEFDVQLSKDNVPVVIHDFDLKRLGRREGFVKDFTAEELQRIDVGSWFNLKNKSNMSSFTLRSFAALRTLSCSSRVFITAEIPQT